MPYNPATGGENVPLGWSPTAIDYAMPQLGTITNDGQGHQYAPAVVTVGQAGAVNQDATLITAVGVTTTQTSADQTNNTGRGVTVVLDMTVPGTGSVTLEIDMKDPASGKYIPVLTGAAVTTVTTNRYTVYPGLTAVANSVASDILARTWRVKVTANNANPTTYTVGASVIE